MGAAQSVAKSSLIDAPRSFSPPNEFKFSKVHALKLTVIQAALRKCNASGADADGDNAGVNLEVPQEAFMVCVATLISGVSRAAGSLERNECDFCMNLMELVRLFTTIFVKNMNWARLADLFEGVHEGRRIGTHLLLSYTYFLSSAARGKDGGGGLLLLSEEILKSFLVLLASTIHYGKGQVRYFHLILGESFEDEEKTLLIEALLGHLCVFPLKTSFISFGSVGGGILPDRSKLALQSFNCLFFPDDGTNGGGGCKFAQSLKGFEDLKSFALLVKFQCLALQSPLPPSDLTHHFLLNSLMVNFCPNYRRFLLSKLDIDEMLLAVCRTLQGLMQGKMSRRLQILQNSYLLSEVLLSFTEDGSFLQQIFDIKLDRNLIKWYECDLGLNTTSLGGFILCLVLDLIGANLALNDGFKDQYLHEILKAVGFNLSQYSRGIDSRALSERVFAILNGLFPKARVTLECSASHCIVDTLALLSNVFINSPRRHAFVIFQVVQDRHRLMNFLQSLLHRIDSLNNSKANAHLNVEHLEFTALIVGILKFWEKLMKFLEQHELISVTNYNAANWETTLSAFPIPSIRRDSRGEACRIGIKSKLVLNHPSDMELWSQYCGKIGWPIVYSSIPWKRYVE